MNEKITLKNVEVGKNMKIASLCGQYCIKLREVGFCEGLDICKLNNNENIICDVCGIKYVISEDLSSDIELNETQYQDPDQPSSEE